MKRMLFRMMLAAVSAGFMFFFTACASSPGFGPPLDSVDLPGVNAAQETPAVSLFVPEHVNTSFFSFADETIMQNLEIGSPSSLQSAAAKLKKSAVSYTESDKVALSIASSIMSMVWPSEKNGIEVPAGDLQANPYTAAIESARIGIYDENTGRSDFFTLVLPSLILVTSFDNNDYYQLSLESLTAALSMNKNSVLASYLLGRLYQRMGKNHEAVEILGSAKNLEPNCFEIQYELARTYFLLGDVDTSLRMATATLTAFPRNLLVLKLCSEISLSKKDFTAAEQYIAQVLQQEPENAQYLLYRIKVLVEQENFIRAVPLLDVYARTDKTSRDYLLLRAQIQHEWNKNSAAAAATLEEAMMLYPDDFEVVLAAAELAAASGNVVRGKTAGQFAMEILALEPDNLKALKICMDESIQKKKWQQAYDYSSVLLEKTGGAMDVQLAHINICIRLGRTTEAKNLADSLYAANSSLDEVKEIYIRTLAALGNRSEVLSLIQSSLPNASSKLKSYLYYQRSLLNSNESDRLSDLRQSLTANPRNQEPLFELYRYYFGKKDYRKAQYYLKQVVALNPYDQDVLRLNTELETLLNQ